MATTKNLTIKIGVDSANFAEVAQILREMHEEISAVVAKHSARIAAAATNAGPK